MTLPSWLEFFGWRSSPQAEAESKVKVQLLLVAGGKPELVGELWVERGEFVFEYSPKFRKMDIPPLPDFPNKEKQYRSKDLWPFFDSRLPPADRDDVEPLVKERGIAPGNTLEMLGEFSQHSVSSPYEIKLAKAS